MHTDNNNILTEYGRIILTEYIKLVYNIGMVKITITENQGNQRLDRFLRKYLDNAPLSRIYKMIRKDIKLNGKRAGEDTVINAGDELTFYIDEDELKSMQKIKKTVKAKKQFRIAYEDENILVAEKPFGLLTHGDRTEKKNHLLNQVIDYLIENGEYNPRTEKTFTPAAVNRLDRNTTGLVLFGKNNSALQELSAMIREKDSISKRYLTIVAGKLEKGLLLRDKMTKNEASNKVTVISEDAEDGKLMETIVRPVAVGKLDEKWYTLTEVEIITGRTHQIRAHLSKAGYPVIGDIKYGSAEINRVVRQKFDLNTQLLHAYRLEFRKVDENSKLSYLQGKVITAQLPEDFERIKKGIKWTKEI